jgi:hypothetical protein
MWTSNQAAVEAEQAYRREHVIATFPRERGHHLGRFSRDLILGLSRHQGEPVARVRRITHAA